MDGLTAQCAAHSIGPANQLFTLLIQTILSAQCSISSPEKWPNDFAQNAIENGKHSIYLQKYHESTLIYSK